MTRPLYRFAFAGDLVESVIDPVVLPIISDTESFVNWKVHEAPLTDPCFTPWRESLATRSAEVEGWVASNTAGLLLRFPGHATFAIDATGADVYVASDTSDTSFTDLVSHLLVDHVAPRRFAMLGENVLHATCIAVPTDDGERAIGLFGATRAGKSTLATYFVRRGARFVADDCLLLRAIDEHSDTEPVGYSAIPSYAGARLWSDSFDAVIDLTGTADDTGGAAVSSWGKSQLDLEAYFRTAPVPVAAVVKLVRSPLDAAFAVPELQRLSPSEATVTLIGTFFLNERGGLSAPELLRRASSLAKDLPVYRLVYPSGYEHLEHAVAKLAQQFSFELPSINATLVG